MAFQYDPKRDYEARTNYKIPSLSDSQSGATFLSVVRPHNAAECEAFMKADLARSGLTAEDMYARAVPQHGNPHYHIPYYDLDGNPITAADGNIVMFRKRLARGDQRYLQPSREQVGDLCQIPYLNPNIWDIDDDGSEIAAICEGEKKAVCVMKYVGIPSIGIGGKDNWRDGGKLAVHPWIVEALRRLKAKRVLIIPDGDIQQFHIKRSYGTLAAMLQELGYEVTILHPEDKIDDLIVRWGPEAQSCFDGIPPLQDSVEDPGYLVRRYALSFSEGKNGKATLHNNESNITKLLREHPFFPKIYYDLDTNTIRIEGDDTEIREGREDMDILMTIQYNLGIHNCKLSTVHSAMSRVAWENAKSPVRDWLLNLEWDGVNRLDSLFPHYCTSEDNEHTREVGAKWLIGAVARIMEPGCIVDFMVITTGAQGVGKSSLPGILFGRDRVISMIGTENQTKDELGKMHMGWCVNFEELASMNGKEKEHLKALITNRVDTFRPAYARNSRTMERRFVLYGSTNQNQFMKHDPSGYRRWGIVEIGQVRFAELERDLEQLWAEAVVRWKNGEAYSNLDHAHDAAEEYVSHSHGILAWDEYFESGEWKDKRPSVDGCYWWTVKDIATIVGMEFSIGRPTFELMNVLDHIQTKYGIKHKTSWKKYEGKQLKRVYAWTPGFSVDPEKLG